MAATILVVEDSPVIRQLIELHLRNAGYVVMAAEDAPSAAKLMQKMTPDLIISDIRMPKISGLEFVAALKSDPALAAIPVIFLTSEHEADGEAKALGAVGYLTKPVRADKLLALVAGHAKAR